MHEKYDFCLITWDLFYVQYFLFSREGRIHYLYITWTLMILIYIKIKNFLNTANDTTHDIQTVEVIIYY